MKSRAIILFSVMLVLVGACLYVVSQHWTGPSGTRTTKDPSAYPMAPDFELTSVNGNLINLKKYRGKVVLLNFWATWCGPCRMEIPGLVDLQKIYGPEHLRIIGMDMISEDSASAVQEFYQRFKLNYPVVLANDAIANLYGGIEATPTSVLIGCNGRIYGEYVGYTNASFFAHRIHGLLLACRSG